MLSAKARAFSVASLLGRKDSDEGTLCHPTREEGAMCSSLGEGPPCRHNIINTISDARLNQDIKVELCQGELWDAFHNLGTEMIITKSGRRMFPAIRIRVSGLKSTSKYRIFLDFISVDKNKYRYVYHSSKWMVSGTGENLQPDQCYDHPDSPMDAAYLSSQVLSFERLKLTNNEKPRPGQVMLISMQKFQPRIHIEEIDTQFHKKEFITSFPQTSFIAVTAYQNQEITRLKIARNPFAKGFRESGKCRSSLEAMIATFGTEQQCNEHHIARKRPLDIMPGGTGDSGSPKIPRWISSSHRQEHDFFSLKTEPETLKECSERQHSQKGDTSALWEQKLKIHPAFVIPKSQWNVEDKHVGREAPVLLQTYYPNVVLNSCHAPSPYFSTGQTIQPYPVMCGLQFPFTKTHEISRSWMFGKSEQDQS